MASAPRIPAALKGAATPGLAGVSLAICNQMVAYNRRRAVICNQEVAYYDDRTHRSHRTEDSVAGPAKPRLARADRFPGIRRLVRGHVHRQRSRQAPASASMSQIKGYEHLMWDVVIEEMIPERRFSWRWHPGSEPAVPNEPTTLVVFELEDAPDGTLVDRRGDRLRPVCRRRATTRRFARIPTAGRSRWSRWSVMSPHTRKRQPGDAAIRASAPIFAALGDDTRLRIVGRLSADGPTSIAAAHRGHRRDPAGGDQTPARAQRGGSRARPLCRPREACGNCSGSS